MDVGRRRKSTGPRIGSVWESRMKLDEVKGGIKVFNGDDQDSNNTEGNDEEKDAIISTDMNGGAIVPVVQMDKKVNLRAKQSPIATSGKRKTWKSESLEGSPIQIARQRSEMGKNFDEQCRQLSVSVDGIKKSPVQKKTRSESIKELLSASVDGIEKSPIQGMKSRSVSVSHKVSAGESSNVIEKNSIQLRKVKSESIKVVDDSSNGNVKNSLQLVKVKSASSKDLEDNGGIFNFKGSTEGIGKVRSDSDDNAHKVFDVCQEKIITSNVGKNVVQIRSPPKAEEADDEDDLDDEFEEVADDEEIEKKSLVVVKEISVAEKNPKKIVFKEKKFLHSNEKSVPIPSIIKKQSPPLMSHSRVHPSPTKTKPIPVSDEYQRIPRTHSKLQSFVDLVMWRDASKSAFLFGIGTFFIISSSYTNDLNISLISVLSYLGLSYLAAIFLFRSFISRGTIDLDDSTMDYIVGEEEAVWFIKLILPYTNEFLLKLKALFSGDPATTMKMAVALFVLARCGSSITIWKMAKFSFFGVFTLPKICSSYSTQLTAYGTFWVRRFRDAWQSCSHKKAVAFAIFTLVWNLSSIVARIWAVFMLFVAFRYYQHSMVREGWVVEEHTRSEETSQAQNRGPTIETREVGPL